MSLVPSFIFVGGAGRSGTTLVQKLLLSHPQIAGGAEFYFTKEIVNLFSSMSAAAQGSDMSVYYSNQALKDRIINFYDSFFQGYNQEGIRYISEKTPTNIEVADQLLALFDNSIFINVYRDGRAVLNSHLQVKERAKSKGKNLAEIGVFTTSDFWCKCIKKAEESAKAHPDRFFDIKYEELITNPESCFTEVFDYLELSVHQELRSPDQTPKKESKGEVHVNDIWYTKEMYEKGLDKSRADKWRYEISSLKLFFANTVMYRELRRLNYPVASFYHVPNKIYFFISNWKEEIRDWWLVKPFILLKRKLS